MRDGAGLGEFWWRGCCCSDVICDDGSRFLSCGHESGKPSLGASPTLWWKASNLSRPCVPSNHMYESFI